jgi:phytoene desaturase
VASVVVVGAGMGGLAVAARLAAQGHEVHIVEQLDTYGGKVQRYERDGFVFDTGPSLLTLPAVYRDLFLKTATRKRDARLEDNVDLQGLGTAFAYRWADSTRAELPGAGVNKVCQALGDSLGGSAADQWASFSRRAADIWEASRVDFLERPLTRRDLLRYSRRLGDLRTVSPWRSLRGLGRQYLSDPRLSTLLDRYATYSGSDPRRAPAALATIPYVEQTFGAWHIGGGMRELARALHERCEQRGVSVSFSCDVTRIVVDSGRAAGVELADGRLLKADVVVSDADASTVYGSLLDAPRGREPARALRRATPSFSGFVMLLAVDGRTPGVRHHNVWFPEDYDAEFDALFGGRAVDDPTIYACVPDDPAMRPHDDSESWFVLVNAPRHDPAHGVDWTDPSLVLTYRERVLDVLAERGVDLRPRLRWSEVVTPAQLGDRYRSPGGSIYGTSSNGARSAFLRPANRSPVPGLFLVGGSAHPGGGLPLVGMGAAIVAEQVGAA